MGLYFNLSEEEREFAKQKTMFCLIIYDIRSNKRRLKLSKLLEGYGVRVQKSCFEVDLSRNDYQSLLKDIESFYKSDEEDSIIVYVTTKEEVTSFSPYNNAEKLDDILFF
jgi:CRISPR-associated protein Cas2